MPKGQDPAIPRRRYASQACTICRARKIKCDGTKPACGTCVSYGRGDECSWGRDAARKPRTEAHFEALRKRAEALQAYVTVLEGMLAKCVCQDVSAHRQFRPHSEVEAVGKNTLPSDSVDEAPDSDEEITRVLCRPTQFLQLDDKVGGLLRHGLTIPFRDTAPINSSNEPSRSPEPVHGPNTSYILLVDGIDDSACEPSFDWSRHLPPEVPLNRKEHDKILDLFFKFFSIFSLRVVPSLFLRDMYCALSVPKSQPTPKTPNYSPMLHNAILALASAFSDDPEIRDANTREYFAAAAKACLEAECKTPKVSLVHALCLLGTHFLTCKGTKILGNCYLAMSARVGLFLGLGLNASAWAESGIITSDEMISRNYAHWMLYSLDVCWSLYFSREFILLPEGPDAPMPVITPEADQLLWHHAPANIPPQPNYLSLIFAASTSLFLIARKTVRLLNGLNSSQQEFIFNDQAITKIDLELNRWKSQLSPEIDITPASRAKSTPQRLMLHCLYHWCSILLHRPFFNRRSRRIQVADREIDHTKLCRRSAENILELLETWSKLYSLRYNPLVLMPVAFTAGTIFLLLSLQAALGVRIAFLTHKKSLSQAELCIKYLREMGQSWAAAHGAADNLQGLLDAKLMPLIQRRHSPAGQQTDADRPNSDAAPLAASGAGLDPSVSPDSAVPLNIDIGTSENARGWYEPQSDMMNEIMGDMPWPQAAWDFIDDPSANELDGLFGSPSFAPPTSFPGADSMFGVDMPQFFPTTFDSMLWEQGILGADESRGG
ncbi:hypothetical protein C8J57DRAFT_1113157 [Mycena rebaudengoi]|nr:hypothetical protein C8J57DRAFT_1113157 [Mycena rebaudengoi]